MFSMCSELAPRAHVPDNRIPQLMQPWSQFSSFIKITRFCPKSQSWDLCNALQCLTCTDMWVLGRVCKVLISGKWEGDEVVMVLKNEKLQ